MEFTPGKEAESVVHFEKISGLRIEISIAEGNPVHWKPVQSEGDFDDFPVWI
jgi:hypothetical protein